ncbi:MAG: GNAT family N-acetyltransferase [Ignavibacteriales bacterium]
MNNVTIEFGFDNMDFDKVTYLISKSHWSPGISIEDVKHRAKNSAMVVGAFIENVQVGYARVISDKGQFAYILDVMVDESYRKKGIGAKLVNALLSHNEFKDVYQWLIKAEADVQKFYNKLGFKPLAKPIEWMEIRLKNKLKSSE